MAQKTGTTELYDSQIDIPKAARKELVSILNQQLADTFDLYSQTKQAHWNVKDPNFYSLHKLYDELADSLEDYVDTIAERIAALGGVALGTVRMAAASSTLPELAPEVTGGEATLAALTERYAAYAASTRQALARAGELGDPTSEDLLIEISRVIDKDLYFLEAHLQG